MFEFKRSDASAVLDHLFGDADDGKVELAWTNPQTGSLQCAEQFDVSNLEALIDRAEQLNTTEKTNIHIGAALRDPESAPFARAKDADFHAATAVWADIDDGDAVGMLKERWQVAPPTLVIATGKTPHLRAQLWWRLSEPCTDADRLRAVVSAIADALQGDPAVVNPSRLMALPGSTKWPLKPGRVVETVEIVPSDNRPGAYSIEQLEAAYLKPDTKAQSKNFAVGDRSSTIDPEGTVASLFRHDEILRLVPAMVEAAESAVDGWQRSPSDTIHAIDREMTRVTYQVIASTILPSDQEAVTAAIERGVAAFNRGLPWAIAMSALRLPNWLPFPGKSAMHSQTVSLRNLVAEMITARRNNPVDHDDLFSRLLSASDPQTGQAMSDVQLIDNLLTFLLAGHDTTAKALTWALYVVSLLPQWAERLRDEVSAVAGEEPISEEHFASLTLTQQFVKEVMRLFPPVPMVSRVAASDTELGGIGIAAGTLIIIPIYVIHRHALLWEDPDRFDPDRFAIDKERRYPRYQHMPFGGGARLCIGAAFALVETTVVLATLLRRASFSFAGNRPPNPVSRIVLLPQSGMPMRVTLR